MLKRLFGFDHDLKYFEKNAFKLLQRKGEEEEEEEGGGGGEGEGGGGGKE